MGTCYAFAVPPLPLVERIARRQADARARADGLRKAVPALARELRALGARRVRLFGSLATGAEPHEGTDIDFCVEGLDESRAAGASLDFETRIKAHVDVVRWEGASERLRVRIDREGVEIPDDAP